MHWEHILVTTDFSDQSLKAFDFAAYQAKMEQSKVTLLNVFEQFELPQELRRIIWDPSKVEQMCSDYSAAAEKKLQQLAAEHFHQQQVQCLSLMSDKSPAKEICRIATEQKCDLIVMSGSGRGFAASLLLGSVVQKVLSAAPCPVLIIK